MTTVERWWTPAATVPLERLLVNGTDSKKDLTSGLFALHRAGAEACELVAKTAVADETVLIAALAETRLIVVPQALGVVSKGVETAAYAGLLLRDLLDDAEASALSLYRTCLSKNVSPPVAAQRVGMVYGVPSRELGKYAALAASPVSKDAAVQDAADRALFTYINKLVESEFVEQKVEVSKERESVRERPSDYLDQQNVTNDPATGRFVAEGTSPLARTARRVQERKREGLSGGLSSGLSGGLTGGLGVQQDRQGRQARVSRAAEPVRARQAVSTDRAAIASRINTSQRSAVPVQRTALQQERARVKLDSTALQMQRIALEQRSDLVELEQDPKPMGLGMVPDVIAERNDPNVGEHVSMQQSLGFAMPSGAWSVFSQAAAAHGRPGQMTLFVAGALQEYAGQAEHFHDHDTEDERGNPEIHQDHASQVKQAALIAMADAAGQPELFVKRLEHNETAGMTRQAEERYLEGKITEMFNEYEDYVGPVRHRTMERGYTQYIPAHDDPNAWVLVYAPKPEGVAAGKRPTPNITEVLIPKSVARGHDQGRNGYSDIEVDQNQPLTIESRKTFFDTDLGVFRSRVEVAKASEVDLAVARARANQVGKAMSGERFRTLENQGVIQRDESGQFADVQEQTVPVRSEPQGLAGGLSGGLGASLSGGLTSTRSRGRATRQARTARASLQQREDVRGRQNLSTERQAVGGRQSVSDRASVGGRASMSRRQHVTTRAAISASWSEDLPTTPPDDAPDVLELTDDLVYAVIDDDSMRAMAADDSYAGYDQAVKPWALGWRAHSALLEHHQAEDGSEAEYELRTSQLPDKSPEELADSLETKGLRTVSITTVKSLNDLWKLESTIHKEMDLSSGQKVLTAHFYRTGGGDMTAELVVHDKDTPPQHLVRWDPEIEDRPVALVPEGEYHMLSKRFVRHWLELTYASAKELGSATEFLANPNVRVWRMQEQP